MKKYDFQVIFDQLDEALEEESLLDEKKAGPDGQYSYTIISTELKEISELRELSVALKRPETLSFSTV